MGANSVLGFDLSPSLCGWAYADGDRIEADAFECPALGSDLGTLLAFVEQHFELLIARFQPSSVAYEAPIMRKWDSLIDVRKIYAMGAMLEYLAIKHGLPCSEVDLKRVKMLLTKDQWAAKPLVVKAVQQLGVLLPKTKSLGKEDAADAVGVALETLRLRHPFLAAPWINKLYGALL